MFAKEEMGVGQTNVQISNFPSLPSGVAKMFQSSKTILHTHIMAQIVLEAYCFQFLLVIPVQEPHTFPDFPLSEKASSRSMLVAHLTPIKFASIYALTPGFYPSPIY